MSHKTVASSFDLNLIGSFLLLLSVSGEKVYRCPLSGDYTAQIGFHLDRYGFPHWQNSTALSPPLQSSVSSRSSSPKPKLRPRSSGDLSPAAGQFVGPESHSETVLTVNKPTSHTDDDGGVNISVSSPTRKSQHEPLDLSVRPESVTSHPAMSPAVLLQMSGLFSNGLSSAVARRLQSYSNAPAELSMKPAYQCDLLVHRTQEEMHSQNVGSVGHDEEGEFEKSEQRKEDNDDAAMWKMLSVLESKEMGQPGAAFEAPGEKKLGLWGRAAAESPISSFESLTPDPLMHQGALLSFLRSQGNLNTTSASAQKANMNMEKDAAPARKPFQCRYCPYSASQKGNLKTHVLCVHRKPFDNSLYPDRRLRRSHTPQAPSRLSVSATGDNRASGRDHISVTSLCGT
uniref:C2H2-type domain-containing protein n=1 Tax=Nothobranchius furzeri TaxID=105023 RepID=A0A8C6NLL3_NOTFU